MSSESVIMSVRELIDIAFGEYDRSTVNFNVIKTIMYILARQLRLLERQVEVGSNRSLEGQSITRRSSSLTVTEVKIHAKPSPKRGKKPEEKLSTTDSKKLEKSEKTKEGKPSSRSRERGEKDGTRGSGQDMYDEMSTDTSDTSAGSGENIGEEKTRSGRPQRKSDDKKTKKSKDSKKKDRDQIKKKSKKGEDEITKKERLLRIINQRMDSLEEARETPTPMTSPIASEKILVVQSQSQEQKDAKRGRTSPKISVVTQEQFAALVKEVNQLRRKYLAPGSTDIPETKELMRRMKNRASLSDSMVALQLSARLETAEKTIDKMISLLNYLAQQLKEDEDEKQKSTIAYIDESKTQVVESPLAKEDAKSQERRQTLTDASRSQVDRVTYSELNDILQELSLNIEKNVEIMLEKNKTTTQNALKICKELNEKLSETILVEMRMGHLEHMVDEYTQKINILDTSLSSQMTHYQELLTQMEHDLEVGIENMAEALANAGGDTTAISELNVHFSSLALDFDNMAIAQKELRDHEEIFSTELQTLWRQVEILKEAKADRDEVEDALRDKAGLDLLNGLTTMMQFEAVRGDIEKRISSAYDKFNSQEFMWQKVIDDFIRELNEKAHLIQLESLRHETNKHLDAIRERLEFIASIVGEPRAAATTRMINRNTACVSCSAPAHMPIEQTVVPELPALPTSKKTPTPAIPAEADGAGDYEPCVPGHPIPIHVDSTKSTICSRYCGGEHTKIGRPLPPPQHNTLMVSHIGRATSTEKNFKEESAEVPCIPCNIPLEQIKEPCPPCQEVCNCFSESDPS